jgi:cytochrome c oxidase assembly factor CtaG
MTATTVAAPLAHGDRGQAGGWPTLLLITLLAVLAAGYGRGVHEVWVRRGVGVVVPLHRVTAFGAGVATLVLAQSPSVHEMAERSFAGHMLQHMLLLVIAAPLLAAGGAGLPLLMAAPPPLRRRLAWWRARPPARWLRRPAHLAAVAAVLHTAALWIWHLPEPYLAALHSEAVHVGEHVSFVGAAWLLWSTVLTPHRHRLSGPTSLLLLFATGMPATALGAVLTLAPARLYPVQAFTPHGGDPLRDQQLAGLVMWIPMQVIVLSAVVVVFLRWLTRLEDSMPADRDRQPEDLSRPRIEEVPG